MTWTYETPDEHHHEHPRDHARKKWERNQSFRAKRAEARMNPKKRGQKTPRPNASHRGLGLRSKLRSTFPFLNLASNKAANTSSRISQWRVPAKRSCICNAKVGGSLSQGQTSEHATNMNNRRMNKMNQDMTSMLLYTDCADFTGAWGSGE